MTFMARTGGGGITPGTVSFNGTSGNWTIPTGARQVIIELIGTGGGGNTSGTAGGGGAYCKKTLTIAPAYWGTNLAYVAGAAVVTNQNGNPSTVTGGGLVSTPTAGGGQTAGAGGTASNGDINTSGGNGSPPTGGTAASGGTLTGGTGGAFGTAGNAPGGGGGSGSTLPVPGGAGAAGIVKLSYS